MQGAKNGAKSARKIFAKRFGGLEKVTTFASAIEKTRLQQVLKDSGDRKIFQNFLRKIWRLKKSPYLCSPFEYERRDDKVAQKICSLK